MSNIKPNNLDSGLTEFGSEDNFNPESVYEFLKYPSEPTNLSTIVAIPTRSASAPTNVSGVKNTGFTALEAKKSETMTEKNNSKEGEKKSHGRVKGSKTKKMSLDPIFGCLKWSNNGVRSFPQFLLNKDANERESQRRVGFHLNRIFQIWGDEGDDCMPEGKKITIFLILFGLI